MVRVSRIVCRSIIVVSFILLICVPSLVSAAPVALGQPNAQAGKAPILQSAPSHSAAQSVPPRPELFAPLTSPPRLIPEHTGDDAAPTDATATSHLPLDKGISVRR
jgi:hypothetical protein